MEERLRYGASARSRVKKVTRRKTSYFILETLAHSLQETLRKCPRRLGWDYGGDFSELIGVNSACSGRGCECV